VLSTLHTTSATQTIERIISTFTQAEQGLLRDQLATNLKAVITQNLVKRAEGKGRYGAHEILVCNYTVSKLIRENRLGDISTVMCGGEDGMQTFDQGLANLVRAQKITEEEGASWARDVHAYKRYVKGVTSSSERGGIISGFMG
jgi:twitching motility protein PilT